MRNWARLGVILAVGGSALGWTASLKAGFALPKLAAAFAGLTVSALALAAGRDVPRRPALLDGPLAACLGVLALSVALSADPRVAGLGRYGDWTYGLWSAGLFAGLLWCAAAAWAGAEGKALRALAGFAVLLAVDALAQKAGLSPLIRPEALPQGERAMATISSPVNLGAWLALLFPAALETALGLGAAAWAIPAVLLAGLWAAGSRGALLGAACGAAVFLLLAGLPAASVGRWSRRVRGGVLAALLLSVCALPLMLRPSSDSDRARREVWRSAWSAFRSRPLVGWGADSFEAAFRLHKTPAFISAMKKTTAHQSQAHNDFLQALATTGLAGFCAYLALLAALGLLAWRAMEGAGGAAAAAAAGGLAALFVVLKFNPVTVEVMTAAAVLAGLLASLAPMKKRPESRPLFAATALLGLGSLVFASRLWEADAFSRSAGVMAAAGRWEEAVALRRAGLTLSPCEPSYTMALVNDMTGAIMATTSVERRVELLAIEAEAAAIGVRCSPRSATSHYAAGLVQLHYAQLGLREALPLAEASLDRALQLNPLYGPLLNARLDAARLRGEPVQLAAWEQRLAQLQRLADGPK